MVEYSSQYDEKIFDNDDGFQIIASVVDPITKEAVTSKYVLYTVKGEDKDGNFEVYRRFSDFLVLRDSLFKRWPGVFLPAIPPKKAVGNLEPAFIEERRKFLEIFIKELAKLKYVWYTDEIKIFLRSTQPDIEKAFGQLPKLNNEELIGKYSQIFTKLLDREVNTALEKKITEFQVFLKRIKDQLEKYRGMIKNLIQVRTTHSVEFQKFLTFLLPQYEQNCLQEYVGNIVEGKYIFAASDQKLTQIIDNIKSFLNRHEFNEMNDLLKLELWEVDCFLGTMDQLAQFEVQKAVLEGKMKEQEKVLQKYQDGKGSKLKSLFSSKSNEDNISETQSKITNREKVNQYYDVIKKIAQFELNYAQIRAELWQYVIENENVAQI